MIHLSNLTLLYMFCSHLQGDHLPTPPPLPKEIIEALEKIANDPRQNDGDDGQYRADANSAGHYNAQQHAQPQQQQNYYNKY